MIVCDVTQSYAFVFHWCCCFNQTHCPSFWPKRLHPQSLCGCQRRREKGNCTSGSKFHGMYVTDMLRNQFQRIMFIVFRYFISIQILADSRCHYVKVQRRCWVHVFTTIPAFWPIYLLWIILCSLDWTRTKTNSWLASLVLVMFLPHLNVCALDRYLCYGFNLFADYIRQYTWDKQLETGVKSLYEKSFRIILVTY